MKVKVKICGIRTVKAAQAAVDAGADFLGFNFVPSSKRYIHPDAAKKIIDRIKRKTQIIGVFQNQTVDKVNKIAAMLSLDFIQLHGSEDSTYIFQVKFPVIKSFTLLDNPQNIHASYLLLDRVNRKGDMVSFPKAAELAKNFSLFLAGGLTPENVKDAIKMVMPFAVDVASGVETNGQQDLGKIKLFIERAKIL